MHCDQRVQGGHEILCSWLSSLTFMDPWCFLWSILWCELPLLKCEWLIANGEKIVLASRSIISVGFIKQHFFL